MFSKTDDQAGSNAEDKQFSQNGIGQEWQLIHRQSGSNDYFRVADHSDGAL